MLDRAMPQTNLLPWYITTRIELQLHHPAQQAHAFLSAERLNKKKIPLNLANACIQMTWALASLRMHLTKPNHDQPEGLAIEG